MFPNRLYFPSCIKKKLDVFPNLSANDPSDTYHVKTHMTLNRIVQGLHESKGTSSGNLSPPPFNIAHEPHDPSKHAVGAQCYSLVACCSVSALPETLT